MKFYEGKPDNLMTVELNSDDSDSGSTSDLSTDDDGGGTPPSEYNYKNPDVDSTEDGEDDGIVLYLTRQTPVISVAVAEENIEDEIIQEEIIQPQIIADEDSLADLTGPYVPSTRATCLRYRDIGPNTSSEIIAQRYPDLVNSPIYTTASWYQFRRTVPVVRRRRNFFDDDQIALSPILSENEDSDDDDNDSSTSHLDNMD